MDHEPNKDYDAGFWEDVNAIRAMLDEEDRQDRMSQSAAVRNVQSVGSQPAAVRRSEPDLNLNFQSQQASDFEDAFDGMPNPCGSSDCRFQKRRTNKCSTGLIATLYIIAAAELAALGGIAYSWYTWLQ